MKAVLLLTLFLTWNLSGAVKAQDFRIRQAGMSCLQHEDVVTERPMIGYLKVILPKPGTYVVATQKGEVTVVVEGTPMQVAFPWARGGEKITVSKDGEMRQFVMPRGKEFTLGPVKAFAKKK